MGLEDIPARAGLADKEFWLPANTISKCCLRQRTMESLRCTVGALGDGRAVKGHIALSHGRVLRREGGARETMEGNGVVVEGELQDRIGPRV